MAAQSRAFNPAEVSVAAMLEEHAADNDALYGVPRWLLTRAFNAAEVSSAATLEHRAAEKRRSLRRPAGRSDS